MILSPRDGQTPVNVEQEAQRLADALESLVSAIDSLSPQARSGVAALLGAHVASNMGTPTRTDLLVQGSPVQQAQPQPASAASSAQSLTAQTARNARAIMTREALMRATQNLVVEKGYGATTTADIVKTAGVSKGTLYTYFASKEDAYFAGLMAAHESRSHPQARLDTAEEALASLRKSFLPDGSSNRLRAVLGAVELSLFLLRHPEHRDRAKPILASGQLIAAEVVHLARTGEKGEPDQRSNDIAFILGALHSSGVATGAIVGSEVHEQVRRIVEQLIPEAGAQSESEGPLLHGD